MHKKNKTFSLGLELVSHEKAEKELKPFQKLEKKLQNLAHEIGQKKEDFQLIKKDRSEKDKIFAKLPFENRKFKVSFWEKKNGGKKKVDPFDLIDTPLMGDVIIEVKHFFISPTNKAITCEVKEVLCHEIEKPPSFFDDFEEISSSDAED